MAAGGLWTGGMRVAGCRRAECALWVARAAGGRFEHEGTPDVFPDYSGYAAPASPSRACRIVLHPSAFLSFPLRYHSM